MIASCSLCPYRELTQTGPATQQVPAVPPSLVLEQPGTPRQDAEKRTTGGAVGRKGSARRIEMSELQQHNKETDCWIAIAGKARATPRAVCVSYCSLLFRAARDGAAGGGALLKPSPPHADADGAASRYDVRCTTPRASSKSILAAGTHMHSHRTAHSQATRPHPASCNLTCRDLQRTATVSPSSATQARGAARL